MQKPFVHLHNHTEYSLLDGAQRIQPMVAHAREMGMPALAITDHGAMFGAMEFYLECKAQGVKPIIGMEAYVAAKGRGVREAREDNYHLLLLARNKQGYRNLCRLATIAALEGFHYKPRVDHEVLREFSEGLISTTTCLGSEVCQYLLNGDYEKAQRTAGMYKEIFGEGNYFVELQDHRLEEQAQIRDGLLRISKELDLPLVCTNDSHYLCKSDYQAHDVLLCIQTSAKVADTDRMRFEKNEFYLKSPEEMAELFHATPEAMENTLAVADMVDVELEAERVELPDPAIPEGMSPQDFMAQLSEEGLKERFDKLDDDHWERLRYELSVIDTTGFAKYFLLVREFAQFTRDSGIYFGVRGSAAGSLVSYCLGITDVDPVKYGLTFERFLNPERIAMPDIDMDFEDGRRDEVIRYVRERFGDDHVAQIITFGTFGPKQAIRDAARALGHSPVDADRLCKLIPGLPGATIDSSLKELPELKKIYQEDQVAKNLIDTARSIEGISRHAGVHAAGVVISKDPIADILPLSLGTDHQTITQYPMGMLEKIGLLKMDFLGLSNLTILAKAVEKTNKRLEKPINLQEIPLDDERTYEMISRGETVGVFQLEGGGMTRSVVELKPQSIDELAAMVALYRPGPMEHIPRYIRGKFGLEKPKYLDPRMEPILKETYGVIVYQDQVLQLVRALAGFTLGEADVLRKAMGKKDRQAMAESREKFVEGAVANGLPRESAEEIFELLSPFAGYAFNKAHAVCYALVAYQTAYMKANYPVEYMAALLGAYREKEERVVGCIEECRRMGIEVLPPDINVSDEDFSIEADGARIRFGLGAIKGIGSAAIQGLLKARQEDPFTHLYDLAERARAYGNLNKSGFEALIKAGSLETIDPNRARLMASLDNALAYADNATRDKLAGQDSLFGEAVAEPGAPVYPMLPDVPMPHRRENLAMEKEVLGLYLSDHPLRGFEKAIAEAATHTTAAVAELDDGAQVILAGVIAGIKQMRTKSKNELMATVTLEDLSGQATVTLFPSAYAMHQAILTKDRAIVVQGTVQHRERRGDAGTMRLVEVIARGVSTMGEQEEDDDSEDSSDHPPGTRGIISIKVLRASLEQLQRARQLMAANPGEFGVQLEVGANGYARTYRVPTLVADGPWIQELRRTLDHGFVIVKRR